MNSITSYGAIPANESNEKKSPKFCCEIDKRTFLAAAGVFNLIAGYSNLIVNIANGERNVASIIVCIAPISLGAFFLGRSIGPLNN
jgi:hypothetical protein